MNGRVYDPEIGVFLSADPLVQFPHSTQGLNRYAYVGNNPLSYTDPSGHLIFGLIAMAIIVKANVTWYAAMAIAAVAGYLDTGDLKAGVFAGLSAGLAYGVGQFIGNQTFANAFSEAFARAATHGLVQGALGAAQGGKFGSAALAGFAGSLLGPEPEGWLDFSGNDIVRVMQAAVAGGTASKIGGGKFANGAMTAAFVQGFVESEFAKRQSAQPALLSSGKHGPEVIPEDFRDGSHIPPGVRKMITDHVPELKQATETAILKRATQGQLDAIAESWGVAPSQVGAWHQQSSIYVPPGKGLTLGTLTHELAHVHQYLNVPDFSGSYQRTMNRYIKSGLSMSTAHGFNPYERQAIRWQDIVVDGNVGR